MPSGLLVFAQKEGRVDFSNSEEERMATSRFPENVHASNCTSDWGSVLHEDQCCYALLQQVCCAGSTERGDFETKADGDTKMLKKGGPVCSEQHGRQEAKMRLHESGRMSGVD